MAYSAEYRKRITIAEAKKRARALHAGMYLGLALLAVEVLKQAPAWLRFLVGLTLLVVILYAVKYWPIVLAIALVFVLVKVGRRVAQYRREHVDPFPEGY